MTALFKRAHYRFRRGASQQRRKKATRSGRGTHARQRKQGHADIGGLADLDEAEMSMLSHSQTPRGRLRLELPVSFGRLHVLPIVNQFMSKWPEISVNISFNDRFVDLIDEGIDLAKKAEHGFGHTASMFSRNIDHLSRMARENNVSIFVKNGPTLAGLGYGGEGYTSFSIASPTGEGLTSARTFSRERRCTMVDHFRIV